MHDVAPSAVTIAVAMDAISCTMNLTVSFLLIIFIFSFSHFYIFKALGRSPKRLVSLSRIIAVVVASAVATGVAT